MHFTCRVYMCVHARVNKSQAHRGAPAGPIGTIPWGHCAAPFKPAWRSKPEVVLRPRAKAPRVVLRGRLASEASRIPPQAVEAFPEEALRALDVAPRPRPRPGPRRGPGSPEDSPAREGPPEEAEWRRPQCSAKGPWGRAMEPVAASQGSLRGDSPADSDDGASGTSTQFVVRRGRPRIPLRNPHDLLPDRTVPVPVPQRAPRRGPRQPEVVDSGPEGSGSDCHMEPESGESAEPLRSRLRAQDAASRPGPRSQRRRPEAPQPQRAPEARQVAEARGSAPALRKAAAWVPTLRADRGAVARADGAGTPSAVRGPGTSRACRAAPSTADATAAEGRGLRTRPPQGMAFSKALARVKSRPRSEESDVLEVAGPSQGLPRDRPSPGRALSAGPPSVSPLPRDAPPPAAASSRGLAPQQRARQARRPLTKQESRSPVAPQRVSTGRTAAGPSASKEFRPKVFRPWCLSLSLSLCIS